MACLVGRYEESQATAGNADADIPSAASMVAFFLASVDAVFLYNSKKIFVNLGLPKYLSRFVGSLSGDTNFVPSFPSLGC